MALFRRTKGSQSASASPGEETKKEKGSWKRPASASLFARLALHALTTLRRYRFQTAAAESMAAYPDTKDGPSDAPHHRYPLCAHRGSPHRRQ
jgi:hypothetical protein